MNIYCLTLKESDYRYQEMEKQFEKFKNVNLIPQYGYISEMSDLDYLVERNIMTPRLQQWLIERPNKIGNIGCFISHMILWMKLVESNVDYMVIIEDDVKIKSKDLYKDIINLVNDVKKKNSGIFDIILLGFSCQYKSHEKCRENDKFKIKNKISRIHYFIGTFGYIISKKCAKYLLKNITPFDDFIDHWISSQSVLTNKIKVFTKIPTIVHHQGEFAIDSFNYKTKYYPKIVGSKPGKRL